MTTRVTVGIDIGTTSVKAVATDEHGTVVARARVPHRLIARHAGELAHQAAHAWADNVITALAEVTTGDVEVLGVNVAAMVPSLCAVDASGRPISHGILYGDARGADPSGAGGADPSSSGELTRFLAWLIEQHPEAAGYWPAQAVANAALCGVGAIDSVTAMTTLPLFDFTGWDADVAAGAGLQQVERLPRIVSGSDSPGVVTVDGPAFGVPVAGGTIDAFAEQLVAGADSDGDVLVILGATLICWAVIGEWIEVPGLWTIPHTAPGKILIGGPSNAGGMFINWARSICGVPQERSANLADEMDPDRVPVWQPYLRGERVPLHDADRRASIHDLDIGMDADSVMRGAYESTGFAIRHQLDLASLAPKRIVATGGGVRDFGWTRAIADCTGLDVHCVAVPEGGALGSAYLARVTAGLERSAADAGRWARTERIAEPSPAWAESTARRYARYRELSDA